MSVFQNEGFQGILLVEPDNLFRECLVTAARSLRMPVRICSTDAAKCAAVPGMIHVHPRASAREIKALFFPAQQKTLIVDMSSGCQGPMSDVLNRYAPRGSRYLTYHSSLTNSYFDDSFGAHNAAPVQTRLDHWWSFAHCLAMGDVVDKAPIRGDRALISLPDLLQTTTTTTTSMPAFTIIDWRMERSVTQQITEPLARITTTSLLSPNKTYLLVGLTRDLGQSLVTLFIQLGARHFILCSRNPPTTQPEWQKSLVARNITIRFESLDVTDLRAVHNLHCKTIPQLRLPPIGGVVNGAMVLDDRVFSHMSVDTLRRVMRPKTIGSANLDRIFDSPDMDFFIMTSSFAAIGGHPGQSNYAAANMFMNGLAADRRRRGLPGMALNIGVIYGLGFLHREKDELYDGLEREGYPAISERDLHHMFVEAIVQGKPSSTPGEGEEEEQIYDIVTGLRRFPAGNPSLHWHHDPRFGHFTTTTNSLTNTTDPSTTPASAGDEVSLKHLLTTAPSLASLTTLLTTAFLARLQSQLHLPPGSVSPDQGIAELGADSLAAVELRNWAWKMLGLDVAVMKILGAGTVRGLCAELAGGVLERRMKEVTEKDEE